MSRLGESTLVSALWRIECVLGDWQRQFIVADVRRQARECADVAGRAAAARRVADEAASTDLPHYKVMALRYAQHEWERIAAEGGR